MKNITRTISIIMILFAIGVICYYLGGKDFNSSYNEDLESSNIESSQNEKIESEANNDEIEVTSEETTETASDETLVYSDNNIDIYVSNEWNTYYSLMSNDFLIVNKSNLDYTISIDSVQINDYTYTALLYGQVHANSKAHKKLTIYEADQLKTDLQENNNHIDKMIFSCSAWGGTFSNVYEFNITINDN